MIRILATLHTLPDVVSYKQMLFENIIPVLQKKTDIHVTWLVYKPQKINTKKLGYTILDIHDFKNALDVVKSVKPDIIYNSPTVNLPDISLSVAGKFLKIPTVGEILQNTIFQTDTLVTVKSFISQVFERTVPTDVNEDKKFMKRGRFYLFKYLFLLRTQRAVGLSLFDIIKTTVKILRANLNHQKKWYYTDFACDLNFVENKQFEKSLLDDGFKKSSLIVTGSPQYDTMFKKIETLRPHIKKNEKINVLFVTHSLFEHGYQTRSQRDSIVKQIITEISKHKNEISLTVKIHPSSEIFDEYQDLIHAIDPSVTINQTGDSGIYLEEADVILSYSTSSSPMRACLLKKPLIFCNFFNTLENDMMLERGLAIDCRESNSLISSIKKILITNPATPEKVDQFIEDVFYKSDGRSSERVSEAILSLLKK